MRNRLLTLAFSGIVLSALAGCGGSSSGSSAAPAPAPPVAASGLAYTDPAGSGWRLVKDASSTSTRLVLNLVGPAGSMTRGVGFNLKAPAGLVFDTFANGMGIQDLGAYNLVSAAANPGEPVALTAALLPGNVLTAGIFQKGRDQSAIDSGAAPLCQVALKLDTKAGLHAGDPLALSVPKARVIPEDIGTLTDTMLVLSRKARLQDISISVGASSAN